MFGSDDPITRFCESADAAGDSNGEGCANIIVGDEVDRIDEKFGGGAVAYDASPLDDDAGADDDSVPDKNGSRDDSLVRDDDGPCGC